MVAEGRVKMTGRKFAKGCESAKKIPSKNLLLFYGTLSIPFKPQRGKLPLKINEANRLHHFLLPCTDYCQNKKLGTLCTWALYFPWEVFHFTLYHPNSFSLCELNYANFFVISVHANGHIMFSMGYHHDIVWLNCSSNSHSAGCAVKTALNIEEEVSVWSYLLFNKHTCDFT